MPRRLWWWMGLAFVGVAGASAVDLFVFPAPRSSRESLLVERGEMPVSVFPALRVNTPFPETVTVAEGKSAWPLALSGSYVRAKTFLVTISFYEVASYSESPPRGTTEEMLESIWRDDGRKAYLLRFLVPLPGWQLQKAVTDEMARSFDDVSIDDYREDIDRLLGSFAAGAHAGDVFYLVRLPKGRIHFGMRTERSLALATSSPPLARAIWRMWAGPTAEPGRAGLVSRLVKSNDTR